MKYDIIIIGTGQAGPPLAISLAKSGSKVAIIEKGHLGGTCVNTGCTPTKAYVASARRAFIARNSAPLGITIEGSIKVDLKKIKARKDDLVKNSRNSWLKSLTNTENLSLIKGKASFKDSHTVVVNDEEISADAIYINVGGEPHIPKGYDKVNYLTNRSILELEEIPDHLIIVGGGYVGLEFAQMFRRFGSEVTILEQGQQLMKQEDEIISEAIFEILKKEGINVRFKAECIGGENTDQGVKVRVNCDEGEPEVLGSHLLMATGRIPNTASLNLEKAGVTMNDKGFIQVNERLQTSVPHIYALGDCNGKGAFTHTAYNDFKIVHSRLFDEKERTLNDRIPCYAAFIDPPLARVGMNAKEIREKGLPAKVAFIPMNKVARAKEMGETEGLLQIFVHSDSNKILGANFLGARADEFIHLIIDIMYAKANYSVIRDAVHIHPTMSELIPTMLEDLKPLDY